MPGQRPQGDSGKMMPPDFSRLSSMTGQASTMRTILLAILALCSQPTLAQEPAQRPPAALLQALRPESLPGTEPMLAETGADGSAAPYLAALVEKPAGAMRLVLVHRAGAGQFEVISRSAPIGGLRGANFGYGIESFRFNAPDRLELALSARADCARALYTHRFALRRGSWLVTGLDVEMPRCTDSGITPGWTESANYLSGAKRRTEFTRSGAPRITTTPGARQAFPLEQFPPPGPEAAYAEMQP